MYSVMSFQLCTNPLWKNRRCPASASCSLLLPWCLVLPAEMTLHSMFSCQVIPQTVRSGVRCGASWDKLALPGGQQCWHCTWRSIVWALAPYIAFFCKQNPHFSHGCDGLQKYKWLIEILIKTRKGENPRNTLNKASKKEPELHHGCFIPGLWIYL